MTITVEDPRPYCTSCDPADVQVDQTSGAVHVRHQGTCGQLQAMQDKAAGL